MAKIAVIIRRKVQIVLETETRSWKRCIRPDRVQVWQTCRNMFKDVQFRKLKHAVRWKHLATEHGT